MTEKQFNRKKLSAIMTLQTWDNLQRWWIEAHPAIPPKAVPPLDSAIYKKTNDRFYLSKWLERFVIKFFAKQHPTWEVHKVDNKGKQIVKTYTQQLPNGRTRKRTEAIWAKNHDIRVGEPDIRCLIPHVGNVWFEVKIGKDTLSREQRDFIARGYGKVYVIKTVEDFRAAYIALKHAIDSHTNKL